MQALFWQKSLNLSIKGHMKVHRSLFDNQLEAPSNIHAHYLSLQEALRINMICLHDLLIFRFILNWEKGDFRTNLSFLLQMIHFHYQVFYLQTLVQVVHSQQFQVTSQADKICSQDQKKLYYSFSFLMTEFKVTTPLSNTLFSRRNALREWIGLHFQDWES